VAIAVVIGVNVGLMAGPLMVFCISVVGQSALLVLLAHNALRNNGGPEPLSLMALVVYGALILQILNVLLLVRAAVTRTPPPWEVLRWIFAVAALALVITILPFALKALFRGDLLRFLYISAALMSPLCQIALLWWPKPVVAEPEEAK